MNIFTSNDRLNFRRWLRTVAGLTVLALCLAPIPAHAGGYRGYSGGRSFGRSFVGGVGFGLGVGVARSLFYSPSYCGPAGYFVYTTPTVYYPATTVVSSQMPVIYSNLLPPQESAPAPAPTPPAASPAPAANSSQGKLGKILYDANNKPVGVLVLNADGSREFVPLAQ